MKLKALDQIHISSVQPDSLRAGQEFAVSDALGAELMAKHPATFEKINDDQPEAAAPQKPIGGEKSEPQHPDKAAPAHPDKADTRRKSKAAA